MSALRELRRGRGAGPIVALALLVLAVGEAGSAGAAELERLDVSEESGTYRIEASLLFDAPPEAVVRALLDFEGQNAIAPPIREIHAVGTTPDGGTLVRVVSEICIGPFCKDVKQLQVVRLASPGAIRARVIPGGGDLASGATAVDVSVDGARTRVRMECTIRPVRRRPSFLPKRWVLEAIRRQARESATGLEALALRIAASGAPSELGR